MLFTAHVVDSGVVKALTRRTPKPAQAPGLLAARTLNCAPFTSGVAPRPQFRREAMVACWNDEASIERFLRDDKTGRTLAQGWHVRMELFRAVGVWPGLDDDMNQIAQQTPTPTEGPTVAVTIGTFYARKLMRFLRVNSPLEDQFLNSAGAIWGTGMTNLPKQVIGTLTIWDSAAAATSYMRTDAHREVVKAHYDPEKDPTGHTFVTGGGFFGFRPLSIHGTLGGKSPIPEIALIS